MELMQYEPPQWLTRGELLQLATQDVLPPLIQSRLNNLLTTPVISNDAYHLGRRPILPVGDQLGPFLRVAFWNIERGEKLDDIRVVLSDTARSLNMVEARGARAGGRRHRSISEALEQLQAVDLLILNEVDLGIDRSGGRDVARELSHALGMNYTFGVEFVEVAPRHLGIELFPRPDNNSGREGGGIGPEEARPGQGVAKDLPFRGLHGNAILSRYPIQSARVFRYSHQGYDWYSHEKEFYSSLRHCASARNHSPSFQRAMSFCQLRRGGRMALIAELSVPELPEGVVTVVTTHLESRTGTEGRRQQMRELLAHIEPTTHPLILAGDLNTSGRDTTPGWIHQELLKLIAKGPFWSQMAPHATPAIGWLNDFLKGAPRLWLIERDPTRQGPFTTNGGEKLFDELERFEFRDGGKFDFRGDPERSVNRATGRLANSNERTRWGFVPTSQSSWSLGPIGRRKLDWMLVKPSVGHPVDIHGSYRFAPHFGRTLNDLNGTLQLSDHHPITVDLPFGEP